MVTTSWLQFCQVVSGKFNGRVKGKRQFIIVNRFIGLSQITVIGSDIGVIDGGAGIERDRFLKTGDGFFMILELEMAESQQVMNIRAFGIIAFPFFKDTGWLFCSLPFP